MEFKIFGEYHEITKSMIVDCAKVELPEDRDNRHKYFVELDGKRYPIKQLLSFAIDRRSGHFTAQHAARVLTKLGFEIKQFEPPRPRPQRLVREALTADKYDTSPGGKTAIRFAVTLELNEDGYFTASCPALVGCHSQGRNRSEAIRNIREAIRGFLASMANHGEAIPNVDWEVVEVAA